MKLYRGLDASPQFPGGSAVTIGKFDGVHRGHQALLARLAASAHGLPAVVVTFEPHPEAFFDPQNAPARITPLPDKLDGLKAAGADGVWILRFNARLAALRAEDFAQRILADGLHARCVLVGDDFRFGHKREGDLKLLKRIGDKHGFKAEGMPSFRVDGERVSSGAVRRTLAAGDLARVRRLLGRSYSLCGRVIRGERLGRRLGYPTANMALTPPPPLGGVFAVRVEGVGEDALPGVASVGTRPTVGGDKLLLEVHLFEFSGNLYGRRIKTLFVAKLRDEHRFKSLPDLVAQMRADAGAAKEILKTQHD